MLFWIQIVLALLPMYFANSSAMLFGGKTPLDLNAKAWDGKRWLGKGKTFKGTFFGVFFGTLGAIVIANLVPGTAASVSANFAAFGFFVSVGAILGDSIGSFLKRRWGVEPGKPVLLLDQLDFLAGGIILGSLFFSPRWEQIVAMVIITLLVHRVSNWIAFKAKLKEVPW